MPRPTRVLAVTVSAVLGVVGGVVSGHLLERGPSGPDPLTLGISMVNQQCTGESLLVTAWGTSVPVLASAVAENPDHTRYLDVPQSCDTAWRQRGAATTGYATYLGPYSTVSQACQTRMTVEHRGDLVTRLDSGNTQPIQCLCYVDYLSMPPLRPGMTVDAYDGIYVRALQKMLVTLKLLSEDDLTGLYDERTITAVKAFQGDNQLPQISGAVNSSTWHSLVNKGCRAVTD